MKTDTEMLDWLILNFIESPNDGEVAKLAGGMLMGKTGRELISFAMSGGVPEGVARAAMIAARS